MPRKLSALALLLCLSGGYLCAAAEPLIRRDSFGVPHILADNEQDAAYAYGYATAEDHHKVMPRMFLRARGELASVFGEAFAEEDFRNAQLRIYQTAADRFGELSPVTQAIFDGYAAGYNAYLALHRGDMPAWARAITGIDVLAYCRAVLLLDFALDKRSWQLQPLPPGTGSNMWAVGKSRSASGRGLLLANPHLPWGGELIFHEVHIRVPGRIDIRGAALLGFPFVVIGFNGQLGWSHTINFLDSDDVYQLSVQPDGDGYSYQYEGLQVKLKSRLIKVRVLTPEGVVERSREVYDSHYGPIIRMSGGQALAFKSANLDSVAFGTEWNLMAKAHNLAEFRGALAMQALPMFNVGYADQAGNVYYLYNGRIPLRTASLDWAGVVRGGTSASEWFSVHPLNDLPQLLNPPSGYIQNCNDAPWYTDARHSVDPKRFPKYMSGDGLGLRGQASLRRLESSSHITLDSLIRIKFDDRLLLADRVKKDLLGALVSKGSKDANLSAAIEVLRSWDNRAAATSEGAVLFDRWWSLYSKDNPRKFATPWQAKHAMSTPAGLGDKERAIEAFKQAVASVKEEYGSLRVRWGDVNRFQRGSVDLPMSGAPGDFGCLRSIVFMGKKGAGKRIAVFGDSFVLAVEFGEPKAFSIVAYSESSDPASAHYVDQARLFSSGQLKPAWFSETDIHKHLEREYRVSQ